ncbi:MAG TPA: cation diffusion facilitator family transporter [Geminicoccus sp.]|jgi:ferrous-iron efflux pump FieF|uniref:cation diffusion facilitator family transporter n=1 Tax=Geminicoccus sp. TaxID=2024832 RepID=UPI002E2FB708|nr:cation diffusion facilitator family transporter [Geminicoccus sp.]HEX2529121.1 cation diffusion facilitator family transporter [Geminicoccus sp.]
MADRWRLAVAASRTSLLVAVGLAVLKLAAVIGTGSVAMMSSAVDSFADVAASGMIWLSLRGAQQPPEPGYQLGQGRLEAVSALTQSAFVAGAGLFALCIAVRQLIYVQPLGHEVSGLAVMMVSLVATLGLMIYQRRVVALTGSSAIAADRAHYESDLFTNIAVVLSLVGAGIYGLHRLDPLIGGALAIYLLFMAYRIGRDAVGTLLDRPLPAELRARIEAVVRADADIVAMYDLRTRQASGTRIVEFHIELAPDTTVSDARAIMDRVELELDELVPDVEVTIHPMPAVHD